MEEHKHQVHVFEDLFVFNRASRTKSHRRARCATAPSAATPTQMRDANRQTSMQKPTSPERQHQASWVTLYISVRGVAFTPMDSRINMWIWLAERTHAIGE